MIPRNRQPRCGPVTSAAGRRRAITGASQTHTVLARSEHALRLLGNNRR